MKNKSSAANGALALSIAGVLSKVISILYTPFLKIILGDIGYGVYCQVLEIFLFVYAITTVGAQPAVAKVVSEFKALNNKMQTRDLLKISTKLYFEIGLIGSLILMLISFPMSKILGNDVKYGILALGPCVLITCILSACRGFMQGNNNMQPIAVSQILEQFFNVVISLLCAYVFIKSTNNIALGVAGAQVGTSIGALVAIIYIIYNYSKNSNHDRSDIINYKQIRKNLIIYSIPIIMSSGLQNLGGVIDMLNVKTRLLSIGLSTDTADMLYGYYGLYKCSYGYNYSDFNDNLTINFKSKSIP